MRGPGKKSKLVAISLVSCMLAFLAPRSVWACAACFGQDSGPMAQGMNWGIFSLLGIIVSVLVSVAGFFIYLARRSVTQRSVPVSGTASTGHGQPSSGTGNPALFKPGEPRPQTA